MESDNDSYFEESSSEDEQEVAGPLHFNVEVIIEESPESPLPGPPSPVPAPPAPIPVDNLAFVWGTARRRDKLYEFLYSSGCARG